MKSKLGIIHRRWTTMLSILSATSLLLIAPNPLSAEVPHTFSPGTTISSSEINANFAAVTSEIAAATASDFGQEWFLQPSPAGSPRNVLVLVEEFSGDNDTDQGAIGQEKLYRVEVFYENEDYSYQWLGKEYTPEEVRIWATVFADRDDEEGNPQEALGFSSYYYFLNGRGSEPDDLNPYAFADHVRIEYDLGLTDAPVDFSQLYSYEDVGGQSNLAESTLVDSIEIFRSEDNQILTAALYSSSINGPIDPVYVPSADRTFSNVVVEATPSYGSGGRVKFRAENVGPVLIIENRSSANDPVSFDHAKYELIYSRIDGVVTGSLENTPFDPSYAGENFSNKFFSAAANNE